jgi:thioredoxin-related protein
MLILCSHLRSYVMYALFFLSLLLFSMLLGCADSTASSSVQEEANFAVLAEETRQKQVVLLLEFHAESCPYCLTLEEDFLQPMLLNNGYVPKVIIRKVQIDSGDTLVNFNGNSIEASMFAKGYGVSLTPTLLFLDADGREVAERIVGLNTPSLFGAYIDMGIEKALKKIRAKNAS